MPPENRGVLDGLIAIAKESLPSPCAEFLELQRNECESWEEAYFVGETMGRMLKDPALHSGMKKLKGIIKERYDIEPFLFDTVSCYL